MLVVLSPAKSLDFETAWHKKNASQPQFISQSTELMDILKQYDVPALSTLMGISDKLAALNVARNQDWRPIFDGQSAKPAILAFNGDVYEGLDASSLSNKELDYAQEHIRILSGLYGLIRPLDLIRAYRLEMGTRLSNTRGKDLYAFWGDTLTQALNQQLVSHKSKVLVDLASEEYFKAVRLRELDYPVVQPIFKEVKNGVSKIVSFYAKRARGVMARYIVQHKIQQVDLLKQYTEEGYRFCDEKITKQGVKQWTFIRDQVAV